MSPPSVPSLSFSAVGILVSWLSLLENHFKFDTLSISVSSSSFDIILGKSYENYQEYQRFLK